MEWEKASTELSIALDDLLAGFACQKKPMFGAPVYFFNGNMFTGVKGRVVFLRLSERDRMSIQEESDEVLPFQPRPGFFMKEYVEIPESRLFDHDFMAKWLLSSYVYTTALPPKEKPARKKK